MKRPRKAKKKLHTCVCKDAIAPEDLFAKACAIVGLALFCDGCLRSPSVPPKIAAVMTIETAEAIVVAVAKTMRVES